MILPIILNCKLSWHPTNPYNLKKIVCWGRKETGKKAIKLSKIWKLPCCFLEDGFLRSFGTGDLFQPLSLILDEKGIYYDCIYPNKLECLIEKSINLSPNEEKEAAKTLLLMNALSKYNHAQTFFLDIYSTPISSKVLLVDQTYGDMSVVYGNACAESFSDMLQKALADNPGATIFVKTHPEVSSGRKKGYLTHIQDSDRIVMIRDEVNPIDLIQKMDKVYVVTSQMGFEALMCGKPVVTFGVPWYAGWGLTDDRVKDSPAWARRTKKRTVDELFAAAYLHYTRYLNPFTHERGTIFDVIEWLILQKKMVANQFKRAL